MKTCFLITARLKSTRLPKKLLLEVCGKPLLAHMIDRIKEARLIDEIVVCTSTNSEDDPLCDLASVENVSYFRGDEEDVVKRLYDASLKFEADYILNITGDCPFVDPVYIDRIVEVNQTIKADLVRALELPHGAYAYGVYPSAIKTILDIKSSKDSEVWTPYFTDTNLFSVYDLPIDNPHHRRSHLRMTLDYPEDLKFFEAVFSHLYNVERVFSLDEILELLKNNPEIVALNDHCSLPYKKRWTRQSVIGLKPRCEVNSAVIVGCGSIGKRHIKNLSSLGITEITALRTFHGYTKALPEEYNVIEVGDIDSLKKVSPDIAIISNPTSLHIETARTLLQYVKGVFIEKPLAASLDGVSEFIDEVYDRGIVSFVGYNLEFHPAICTIRDLITSGSFGTPMIFQCQVGQWLPDWHPYEEYKDAYYARKSLGGGAMLTLNHELHLAESLIGPSQSVGCFLPHTDLLEVDVETVADLMIKHVSGAVSQVHLDFIQKPSHRVGVLSCERGRVNYDLSANQVFASSGDSKAPRLVWEDPLYDINDSYVGEMKKFLEYVREGRMRHEFDVCRAKRDMEVVEAAFESHKLGRFVQLTS